MSTSFSIRSWCAGLVMLAPVGMAHAGDDAAKTKPASQPAADEPGINLFEAARAGAIAVSAEGTGDGAMTIRVTNRTNRKLKVVLPPGLVASGATGQMGGMGGMGGGMGGGGMGGGGMGGGGMGGGGMGGGGMGGRGGGGMGGGMMGGSRPLTMMPMQGLSAVANMIMNLVQPDTWDRMAFMRGMMAAMGSMGGGMMGGMGGGMGGMGGGMGGMGGGMGGMGGGFRSVPPVDLPTATVAPGQSRGLRTRLVRLGTPDDDGSIAFPAQGEPLTLSDVGQAQLSPKVRAALVRLSRDGAPESIAQMTLWAAAGMPWADVARLADAWANPQELALAKQLVADLDAQSDDADTGRILIEVSGRDEAGRVLAGQLASALKGRTVLGLAVEDRVPSRPVGPSLAVRVQVGGTAAKPEAMVQLASSDATASSWAPVGKFELPVGLDQSGQVKALEFNDALAAGLLDRLVKVSVRKGPASGGVLPAAPKTAGAYVIRIENYSPLLLNGVAISGMKPKAGDPIKMLLGISLSPRRTFSVPVTAESVERLGLKNIKPVALDLSGL